MQLARGRVAFGLLGIMIIAGIAFWLTYTERSRLDAENQRELAHVAGELEASFSEISSSAHNYFKDSQKQNEDGVRDFAARTRSEAKPWHILSASQEEFCLDTPRKLILWKGARQYLSLNAAALVDDVAISQSFEYLLIAAADGSVTFSIAHGPAARRAENLGFLQRTAREEPNREHAAISVQGLGGLSTADGKALDPSTLAKVSGSQVVRAGGIAYKLLTYPVSVPACGASKTWIVGGLISDQAPWWEAISVSPRTTAILFGFLLLAFAAEPLLKALLVRSTERFRYFDACMLLASAVVFLSISAVFLIEQGTRVKLDTLADGELKRIGQLVEEKFIAELRAMKAQLNSYDEQLWLSLGDRASHATCASADLFPPKDITDLHSDAHAPFGAPDQYRNYTQVSWINPCGIQMFKASSNPEITSRQNVSKRPYYLRPHNGHLWRFAHESPEQAFFVQTSRSITTAQLFTFMSMRSRIGRSSPDDRDGYIAAMSAQPLFVQRPFLPGGFSFAIIAEDGQVLYHSDRRRMLKENLFENGQGSAALRAAVTSRKETFIGATYARGPVDMYVRPIEALPDARWSVVALRDRRILDGASTEVFLRTALWLGTPLGLILLLAVTAFFAGKGALAYWWPDPRKACFYRTLAVTYSLIVAAGVILAVFNPQPWIFASSPVFLGSITIALYGIWRWKQPVSRCSYRRWYIAALGMVWAAAAILPAFGLFRHSFQLEMAKLNEWEQARARVHAENWLAEQEAVYRPVKLTDPENFFHYRAKGAFVHRLEFRSTARPNWFDDVIDRSLPFYARVSEQTRYRRSEEPSQNLWCRNTGTASVWQPGLGFSWISLTGVSVCIFVCYFWLRFNTDRMFWVELQETTPAAIPSLTQTKPFLTVVAASPREKKRLIGTFASPMAAAAGGSGTSAATEPVAVEDFESHLADKQRRLELLARLEDADASGRPTVIVAMSGPLELLAEHERFSPGRITPEEKERWLEALAPFTEHAAPAALEDNFTDGHYRSLWTHLSHAEQLTLIHIAHEGFANPKQAATVERLAARGLLKFGPNLQIANDVLEKFVLRTSEGIDIDAWEQPGQAIGWRNMRWGVLLVIMAIAVLIMTTSTEPWLRGATLLVTGMEMLSRLVGAAQKIPVLGAGR